MRSPLIYPTFYLFIGDVRLNHNNLPLKDEFPPPITKSTPTPPPSRIKTLIPLEESGQCRKQRWVNAPGQQERGRDATSPPKSLKH